MSYRKMTTSFLRMHKLMWDRMGEEIAAKSRDRRLPEVSVASSASLSSAVALAWVARECGADKADKLARLMESYSDDGSDIAGLFTEFPEFPDTSIMLLIPDGSTP